MSETTTLTVIDAESTAITVVSGDGEDTITVIGGEEAPVTVIGTVPNGPPGADGTDGTDGVDGEGVPTGGTTGQVLAKDSNADFDTEWVDQAGGSGLPDPWTANQTSGEVTAQTDGALDITALEFLAAEGQEVAPLIITSDTELGSTDLIRVRQSVAKGDSDIFTVDDSGEVDITLVDPAATGLNVTEAVDGESTLVDISGSMTAREGASEIVRIAVTGLAGGESTRIFFDGGLRFDLDSFGQVWEFDPVTGTSTLTAHTGQTAPLLVAKDENGDDVARILASGAIGTSAAVPADADIATGEVFWWFDSTTGAPVVNFKGRDAAGTVFTRTYEVAGGLAAHLAGTADAHDASAVSFVPNGSIAATDVQAAIQEVRDEAGSGSLTDAVILEPTDSARNVIQATEFDATSLTVIGAAESSVPSQILQTGVDQDQPVLSVRDENGDEVASLLALLAQTQLTLRAAIGQAADDRILRVLDQNGDEIYAVNTEPSATGATRTFTVGFGGAVSNEKLDFQGAVFAESSHAYGAGNNLEGVFVDVFHDNVDVASSYALLRLTAFVSQVLPIVDIRNSDEESVARALPSGAISTLAGEPADSDILNGECFRYFDPTNGAARTCLKGKTLDGTVVFGFAPMGP